MDVEQIAIILLTKNGAAYLDESLDAILAQASRHRSEVLAVDSGSTDTTRDILEKHAVRVIEIAAGDFQHGRTRNLAAGLVSPRADYLIFLSQDATPLSGWLDALIGAVAASDSVAGAFSRHIPRPDCNPLLARRIVEEWEQVGGDAPLVKCLGSSTSQARHGHALAHFSNTSSCLRRCIWQQIPFPEVAFAEDTAWAVDVLNAGYSLVYEPRSQVLHSHSGPLLRQFLENIDHGRGVRSALEGWTAELMQARHPVRERLRRDLSYIWHRQTSVLERIRWTLYAPSWYLASVGGQWVGARIDHWPHWLQTRLSWQTAMQQRY